MRISKTTNLINAFFLLGALSALTLTPSAWANVMPNTKPQCPDSKAPTSKEHLSAHYRVTSPQGQTWDMHFMRNQEQLIISRNQVTFEGWNNSEYVRYFPQEKRSVTYRKSDLLALNIQYDHDQLYHVVAPSLLSKLDKTQTTPPS